jgi:hypothetical protein
VERLSGFDFCDETLAVPSLQKFRSAKRFATLGRLGFNGFEKPRSSLIQEIGLALGFSYLHISKLEF